MTTLSYLFQCFNFSVKGVARSNFDIWSSSNFLFYIVIIFVFEHIFNVDIKMKFLLQVFTFLIALQLGKKHYCAYGWDISVNF